MGGTLEPSETPGGGLTMTLSLVAADQPDQPDQLEQAEQAAG